MEGVINVDVPRTLLEQRKQFVTRGCSTCGLTIEEVADGSRSIDDDDEDEGDDDDDSHDGCADDNHDDGDDDFHAGSDDDEDFGYDSNIYEDP